jgi:ABC-2 type transport system ATP-binding protein
MSVVTVNNLVKRYGNLLALDHVNLEIQAGEIIGLLGPNGAGKTTLIHALVGLIATDAGTIHCFGKAQQQHLLDIKRSLGLVTQDVTIFEELTARENLEFFGGIYGLRGNELKTQVAGALEFVSLQDQAGRLPAKFSGGMKRRLNIAAALVHEPKLLIMDEPTVGIDPQSRNYILESVRRLRDNGTTILYTTHYTEEVEAIATRIIIMDQGHIIAEGSLEELTERIHHEEKITLEVGQPTDELDAELQQITGVKQVLCQGTKVTIISQSGSGNLDRVISVAKRAGGVRSVTAERPTLEDVFLTLTGKQLRDMETV